MATALAGVDRESVEQWSTQLAIVKENLRQAIQQRTAKWRGGRAALWLKLLRKTCAGARRSAGMRGAADCAGRAGRSADKRTQVREAAAAKEAGGRGVATGVRWVLFALLPLALIVGGYWYVTGGQVMSTDDAYVDAEKVGISTDVSGIVQDVDVTDNQHVAAGQVLYRLDPAAIPDRARQRQGQSGADRADDRGDEAGLQAHAERHRRAAGAGRSRSRPIRSRRDAAAQRHRSAGDLRSGEIHARRPTRASSNRCASRRRCSSPARRQCRTST